MHVTARCHCGQVRLSAEINPARVFVCFCTDCQKLTGSAFRTVVPALPGSVQLDGQVHNYTKTAASGKRRIQSFCPVCGSPMFARAEDAPDAYMLRVGVLDQASQLIPTAKLWQSSQWRWTEKLSELPGCEHQELL